MSVTRSVTEVITVNKVRVPATGSLKSSLGGGGERNIVWIQIKLQILIHDRYYEEKVPTSLLKIDLVYSSCADMYRYIYIYFSLFHILYICNLFFS